ncbi:MAG: hypothetical protein ABW119_22025 [Candidatus Thiodiazotropha lotti]
MSNFIQMCVNGDVLTEEIDDFVDQWHEDDSDVPLNVYLGMTKLEYKLWIADSAVLPYIVTAHKEHRKVGELIEAIEELPLAARAGSPKSAERLYKWLAKEGLLED